jgi:opacity protein-like surface antigen
LFDKEAFMRSGLLAAVGLFAVATTCGEPAAAADLLSVRQPLPMQQPVPPYVPDWVGFYFGIHGGGAWDHASFDEPPAVFVQPGFSGFSQPGATLNGGLVGGHAGYNWQYGVMVGGVEVDFSGADLKQTSQVGGPFDVLARESKIDELASARGRIGWAMLPSVLAYGTGGIAWAHTRLTFTDTFFGTTTSADENAFGWVAGAGLEYRIFEHVLLRAEYLHYDFGSVTFPNLIGFSGNINVRNRIDVVRGGLSYKF